MDLECHVEAYPPPQITWTKDSSILTNSKKYKISNFNTADEFTDSTLRIITLNSGQYGEYRCEAVNKLGRAESVIYLHESKNPVCPPACGTTFSSANCHKISFTFIILAFFYAISSLRRWIGITEILRI